MKPSQVLKNNHNPKNFSKYDEDLIKIIDYQDSQIQNLLKRVSRLEFDNPRIIR